ncbi:hypothetical protein Tco_1284622 [Tanacetum coccineum]
MERGSHKSPTAVLFDADTGRISIRHCEMLKSTTLNVLSLELIFRKGLLSGLRDVKFLLVSPLHLAEDSSTRCEDDETLFETNKSHNKVKNITFVENENTCVEQQEINMSHGRSKIYLSGIDIFIGKFVHLRSVPKLTSFSTMLDPLCSVF